MTVKNALKRPRFTVDNLYKMLDAGILYEGQKVELLKGILIQHGSDQPHRSRIVT